MSIDDRILIDSNKSFKEVAKLFLEQTEFLTEKLYVTETERETGIDYVHWSVGIGDYVFDTKEYEDKLGIKPKTAISINVNKNHIHEARTEILRILLKLIQVANYSFVWFHNYAFPVLVYRNGKLILKSTNMFWQQHSNMLPDGEIEFQDLPQF